MTNDRSRGLEPFSPEPPAWIQASVHAVPFQCPRCRADARQAVSVWINRRSPVFFENRRRAWQEFYHCECGCAWWGWSCDRPVPDWLKQRQEKLEADLGPGE